MPPSATFLLEPSLHGHQNTRLRHWPWIDDAQLKLYDVQYHCAVNCNIAASELCVQHGDLYIRAHQHVTRIGLQRLGQRLLASSGASLR